MGEEVILSQVGADLGVGCGLCGFRRAAGHWVSEEKIFGTEEAQAVEVHVVLGAVSGPGACSSGRGVRTWLRRAESTQGFGFLSSDPLLTPPHTAHG